MLPPPNKKQLALWSPHAIRERCQRVLDKACDDQLVAYRYCPKKLDSVVDFVIETIDRNYPDGIIPPHSRWRHFETGGIDRWSALELPDDQFERARISTELTITSVLLDAGAGADWQFFEPRSTHFLNRSEGLGVASFYLYSNGGFSDTPENPLRADAEGLQNFTLKAFETAFQVSASNPLIGAVARVELLQKLGKTVAKNSHYFPDERLGAIVDTLQNNGRIDIEDAFPKLIHALSTIWPNRGDNYQLGDVWQYAGIAADDDSAGYLPFHKLTQWMCYSLVEAWRNCGIDVNGEALLTALPEYRNGGLLIDFGVLSPRDLSFAKTLFEPGDPAVLEMRAMTIAVIDIVADKINAQRDVPLSHAQILEGGTWSAGRAIAKKLRADGSPPINYVADGTLF